MLPLVLCWLVLNNDYFYYWCIYYFIVLCTILSGGSWWCWYLWSWSPSTQDTLTTGTHTSPHAPVCPYNNRVVTQTSWPPILTPSTCFRRVTANKRFAKPVLRSAPFLVPLDSVLSILRKSIRMHSLTFWMGTEMTDAQTIKQFFTESEWTLIYDLVCSNSEWKDDKECKDHDSIINKIHKLKWLMHKK